MTALGDHLPGGNRRAHDPPRTHGPRPAARRSPEPPAGQPISGSFLDPLTDEQRHDIARRLAEKFPDADPADFWAKDVQPPADGTAPPLPPPQPAGDGA